MSLCCTLVFCRFFIIIFFFPLWLSVSLDLAARVALGSSFYPYLDVQECDTSRYALRNFNIFWPAALKKMCVRVSVCVSRWWRVLVLVVVVGGWGRIHGNTPPPPPLGPKRQSLTHIYTHAHGALQGQLSQINISPHLKNRIQRMAFQRPDYSRALDLGFLH